MRPWVFAVFFIVASVSAIEIERNRCDFAVEVQEGDGALQVKKEPTHQTLSPLSSHIIFLFVFRPVLRAVAIRLCWYALQKRATENGRFNGF
jgi:hypothetical protein